MGAVAPKQTNLPYDECTVERVLLLNCKCPARCLLHGATPMLKLS